MNNNKNTNGYVQDEREIQNNDKALAGAAVVSMICNFGLMIYGLVRDNMVVGAIGIIQLCLMGLVVAIIKNRKDGIDLPKTIGGKTVSTEMTRKGRLNRIAYCCLDSVVFCIAFTLLDLLMTKSVTIPELAIQFVILFVISFILEFISVEYTVKKYNKLMAELEGDDEDIDE